MILQQKKKKKNNLDPLLIPFATHCGEKVPLAPKILSPWYTDHFPEKKGKSQFLVPFVLHFGEVLVLLTP